MGKKEKEKKDKPLDKMTAPELRTIAKELPDVAGVHGMNKTELLKVIKKARGIDEAAGKGKNGKSVRDLKVKIRELKAKKEAFVAESDHKMTDIVRRRISRLKKKTRNAA
jgi:protein-arginine kinase activator protein McsA